MSAMESKPMIIPVILSGGSGTRLWPLSRINRPKQFIALTDEHTLFQKTALRARGTPGGTPPIVVCSDEHRFMVAEQLQDLGMQAARILLEPAARNTAPAIALAAHAALEIDPEAVMLVLPADHLIGDEERFADAVERGIAAANSGWLVTFGITPNAPETGFGYIKQGAQVDSSAFKVGAFVEKPDAATAQSFIEAGGYAWNSGMFLFKASAFLLELEMHAPAVHNAVANVFASAKSDLDFMRFDAALMQATPSDSIDYAVMERTNRSAVVPVDCEWSDIGSWSALWQAAPRDGNGNAHAGDVVSIDSTNNLVRTHARHMVATVGVHNLIVVTTPDATLVASIEEAQSVKKVVEHLKAKDRSEHIFHRKVYRPWGSYDSIDAGERFQVKRIVVKPGAALSLQKHHHRAEHWIVVTGTAEVTCDDKVFLLAENQSTYLPLGSVHRLRNPGKTMLELIEVQSGSYLGEDDIVRFEDVYGRA